LSRKNLRKCLAKLHAGDLVCVEWCDASVGKSSSSRSAIDVPVKSWGVFVGVFGSRAKHIVLAQNSFKYNDGLFDLDYTAIPVGWTLDLVVVAKSHLPAEVANNLVNSFVLGGHRAFSNKRIMQQRVNNHERHS
jgi:hypothetical protein